jgi:hypothetical protein
VQTGSCEAVQKSKGSRAADEHGDFIFKHPERKSRQKKNDCQYAPASFWGAFIMPFAS